ncbi:hypothetical protein HUE56_16880 [Azospirillum oryzae]|uniref:Uncharacterized protein n=1 Tax=Azospirillum oryzae TaxID=286727 RepID=A0A6N1AK97_9PROT|nr:hypothetical protein [Azospirillum oryzae]KAA0590810.1 hypothetical protein FZ938_01470 [Azospirillum oryzae]QKS52096.1 hypothetical protein HUE56_16880 [Azospirillum oryzae]GLR77860.1 hypothetical protein GCM10007856_05290 [Azospirillum oryzae]
MRFSLSSFCFTAVAVMMGCGVTEPLQAREFVVNVSVLPLDAVLPSKIQLRAGPHVARVTKPNDDNPTEYKLTLDLRSIDVASLVKNPVVLVAEWRDKGRTDQEVVLLRPLSKISEDELSINIFRNKPAKTMSSIEGVEAKTSADMITLLEKISDARYIYKKAVVSEGNGKSHQLTLRAAKDWFQFAYELATLPEHLFGMEEDIVTIMAEYEAMAREDQSFADRYRKLMKLGQFEKMKEVLDAQMYADVALVDKYIVSGNSDIAEAINQTLRDEFNFIEQDKQKKFASIHRIHPDIFEKNAIFIRNRKASLLMSRGKLEKNVSEGGASNGNLEPR